VIAAWGLAAPLLSRLAQISPGDPFVLPAPVVALRALATNPTGLIAFVLAIRIVRLAQTGVVLAGVARAGQGRDPALALERGLRRFARAVHTVVEAGVSASALSGVAQGTLGAARLAHRWIEGVALEGTARQIAQTATESGRLAYRVMEQGGLEGLLRRAVRAVLAGSRWLQRRHTGRLRLNLVWVAASLALAALALILFVW
jgi:hypothetical protein